MQNKERWERMDEVRRGVHRVGRRLDVPLVYLAFSGFYLQEVYNHHNKTINLGFSLMIDPELSPIV